ncbi:cobalamin binding intrinsic factor-like [Haliotis asinina]|uniref:cobalamin binding intrinsic factor-like n=1 Tax=Haliotis asinina TaxID=109174 RepID=UPI00353237B0
MSTLSCACLLAFVALALTYKPDANNQCCMCGPNITVTMEVQNSLKPPVFQSSVKLEMPQRELIYFLQAAVAIDPHFHFTAEFYATPNATGYDVLSMNKVAGSVTDRTYWEILDNGAATSSVSVYVPKDGSVVTFNFTSY